MDFWSEIVGQPEAVRILNTAAVHATDHTTTQTEHPTHAWLITGPPGSGRSNLAFRFAAALLAPKQHERASVYEQVRARTHPDLGVLTTQKLLIDIQAAREIVMTAHYAPAISRYRVIVIEDADRMPERTSNVLLKALEEPPERTIWILCAPSEADLLPTIRSRTRSLRLATPPVAEIAQLLNERDGVDAATAARAARLAQNHIGMARRLASDPEALERRERTVLVAADVNTLGEGMKAAAALTEIAESDAKALTAQVDAREREDALRALGLPPGAAIPAQLRSQIRALEEEQKKRATRSLRDAIDRILTDVLSLYRDVLLISLGAETQLVNAEHASHVTKLAERWPIERTLHAVSALESARERLAHHITPGLVLEALFAGIATGSFYDQEKVTT